MNYEISYDAEMAALEFQCAAIFTMKPAACQAKVAAIVWLEAASGA